MPAAFERGHPEAGPEHDALATVDSRKPSQAAFFRRPGLAGDALEENAPFSLQKETPRQHLCHFSAF